MTTQLSGKRVGRDRVFECQVCGRTGDIGEQQRCEICEQYSCMADHKDGVCLPCSRLLSKSAGRALDQAEVRALAPERPWVRRGWIVESHGVLHVHAESRWLSLHRESHLLVFARSANKPRAEALAAPLVERRVDKDLLERAASLANAEKAAAH